MENFGIHIGGADESLKEKRDVVHTTLAAPVPATFDADFSKIPVQMQNKIGICTAEAVCTLIERFRNDGVVLSRRFTYCLGKQLVDFNTIEGSSIKSMLHGAYKWGTMPESVIPTDTTMTYEDFIDFHPEKYFAQSTKIPGYTAVPVSDLQGGIYKYGGLAVRFECGTTWWTDVFGNVTWNAAKILPLRPPEEVVSGHAVCAIAYDPTEVTYRNSWSTAWALGGNGYTIHSQYKPTEAYGILKEAPVIPVIVPTFTKQMGYGTMGNQVYLLQRRLIQEGVATFAVATGFYGERTFQSVKNYQDKYRIIQTGYVGPLTLARLNKT